MRLPQLWLIGDAAMSRARSVCQRSAFWPVLTGGEYYSLVHDMPHWDGARRGRGVANADAGRRHAPRHGRPKCRLPQHFSSLYADPTVKEAVISAKGACGSMRQAAAGRARLRISCCSQSQATSSTVPPADIGKAIAIG